MVTKKELLKMNEKDLDEIIIELKIKLMKPIPRNEKIDLILLQVNKMDAVYDPIKIKI